MYTFRPSVDPEALDSSSIHTCTVYTYTLYEWMHWPLQISQLKSQLLEKDGDVSRARRATHAANMERQEVRGPHLMQ